jgi:uncharacterized protein (TIGR03435 family)
MTIMKGATGLLMLGWMATPLSVAQSQAVVAPHSSFEVATIRQTAPGCEDEAFWSPPGVGKFNAKCVSLVFLIQTAYGVDNNQISGKPNWLESEHYDVAAKPEVGIALTREQLKPMLQDLLQQRFHLQIHRETKMVRGYALVVAKSELKLKPTKGDQWPGFRVNVGPGKLEGINWSMPYLAAMLTHPAGLPVVDKTGIAGSYDIKLDFAPDLGTDSSLPSLFSALQDTLGLKLQAQQIPVNMLVIDHVERVPTEN